MLQQCLGVIHLQIFSEHFPSGDCTQRDFFSSRNLPLQATVVSEKKGAFICELIEERYIYLRNTQKQLEITNYGRNKSFLEFYLVYNGVCLKLLGSLL